MAPERTIWVVSSSNIFKVLKALGEGAAWEYVL